MEIDSDALIAAFDKIGLKADLQPGAGQVLVKFSEHGFEYPMFVRVLDGGNLIQMLTFVPCNFDETTYFPVSRLLHMINKELDMPGFGCDEDSRTVFYRVIIPMLDKRMNENLLQVYAGTSRQVCKMFGAVVHAVAINAMPLDEVLKKAKEMKEHAQTTKK